MDFDHPQSRAVWRSQLEGHHSDFPFSKFGPISLVGTGEFEDCQPS
jgi:hypothetical protein